MTDRVTICKILEVLVRTHSAITTLCEEFSLGKKLHKKVKRVVKILKLIILSEIEEHRLK